MSEQEIERFTKAVAVDTDLQAAMAEVVSDWSAVVEVAKANGYDFTLAEVEAYQNKKTEKLTDEDLEKISGGTLMQTFP